MIKVRIFGHECYEDEILEIVLYELTPRQQYALLMHCIEVRYERAFGVKDVDWAEKDRLASFVDRCWDVFIESVIVEIIDDVTSGKIDEYVERHLRVYERDEE